MGSFKTQRDAQLTWLREGLLLGVEGEVGVCQPGKARSGRIGAGSWGGAVNGRMGRCAAVGSAVSGVIHTLCHSTWLDA